MHQHQFDDACRIDELLGGISQFRHYSWFTVRFTMPMPLHSRCIASADSANATPNSTAALVTGLVRVSDGEGSVEVFPGMVIDVSPLA